MADLFTNDVILAHVEINNHDEVAEAVEARQTEVSVLHICILKRVPSGTQISRYISILPSSDHKRGLELIVSYKKVLRNKLYQVFKTRHLR